MGGSIPAVSKGQRVVVEWYNGHYVVYLHNTQPTLYLQRGDTLTWGSDKERAFTINVVLEANARTKAEELGFEVVAVS